MGSSSANTMARDGLRDTLFGLLLVFLGGCCFAAQNLFVAEAIACGASALEMTTGRGVIMFLCAAPCMIRECRNNPRYPLTTARTPTRRFVIVGLALRAGFGWISMAWQHMALEHMPLGDVAALCWTAPLFTALLGWASLGEKMGRVELACALSIVVGVFFVSRPPMAMSALGLSDSSALAPSPTGLALCTGSSLTIACTICVIRRLAPMLHWASLTSVHGLGQSVLSPLLATFLGVSFVRPSAKIFGYILSCGLCGERHARLSLLRPRCARQHALRSLMWHALRCHLARFSLRQPSPARSE
jgi:drug/metabolite transporter (DMT)-like permease